MNKLIIGMCLSLLLAGATWARESNPVTVNELLKTSTSWDGTALPEYPAGTPEVTVLRITIPPHVQLPVHKHPVINAGMLLSGALTVETEHGDTLYLEAGDSIAEVVDTWHAGRNEGDVPAEILVVYVGVQGMPTSINQ